VGEGRSSRQRRLSRRIRSPQGRPGGRLVKRLPRLTLAIAAAALAALSLFIVFTLAPEARFRKDLEFSTRASDGGLEITEVRGGAAPLLQAGDTIAAWNAVDPRTTTAASLVYRLPPDQPYDLELNRHGRPLTVRLAPARVRNPREPARTIQLTIIATIWAALSLVVLALSPHERASRWCAAYMLLAAASQFGISLADIDHPVGAVQTALRFAGFAAYPWHIVCAFLMASALVTTPNTAPGSGPKTLPKPQKFLQGLQILITAMAAIYTIVSIPWLFSLLDPNEVATIADVSAGARGLLGRLVLTFALAGTIALLAIGYRRAPTETQRRRTGWLLGGLVPAAVAYIISALISVAARSRPSLEPLYERALVVTLFTSLSVPMAFAYALARHELFGVRVVVRRSIQYALARNALLAMLAVPIAGLLWTVWRDPDVTVRGLLSSGTIYLLAAIAVSLASREKLLATIDRHFFRDVRDRERILVELASDIGRVGSASEAVALAERALHTSLHPSSVHVWLREEGAPFPEAFYASDTVSLDDADARDQPPANDFRAAALTVPIVAHGGELIGALLLGTKRSEEPYTTGDRSLLRAIARQIAIVVENAKLRREVGEERRIRHEVLQHLDRNAVDVMRECPTCGRCFDRDEVECPHDRGELMPTLPVQRTIEGKYRLDRLIGRGGMGAVYDATDVGLGRRIAVKVLRPQVLGSENSRRRFHREARILGGISHRGIVTVHDYGPLPSGGAFIVMERVDGATWRAILQRRQIIPPTELAPWIEQLCDALSVAHGRGVVHRDLKPENVIIQNVNGMTIVKVLDFGLAKQISESDTDGVSLAGSVLGTLGYMSPQQLAGRPVDQRADVFAVGVMAWEALCGTKPFAGTSAADLAIAMHQPAHDPDGLIPADVRSILENAIAHDLNRRLPTVDDIKTALVPALMGQRTI
jgi:tRNA A-37 threonylcarbamoyl transferase component Bud32